MEEYPGYTPFNRLQVLDDLITNQEVGEHFSTVLWRTVDAAETLPPNEHYLTLLALNERAYQMEYRLRAGVQSAILDRAMQVPGVSSSTPLMLDLHLMQVDALTQDVGILRPYYYGQSELDQRIPATVAKLHEHGNVALEIMKHRPYRKHPGKSRCRAVLHMVPPDYHL